MKTTSRFFASFASAAIALALSTASAAAAGAYTLAWGGNDDGQLGIPAEAFSNATQIVADAHHSLALVDERIVGWGASDDGALSFNTGLQNIKFIATGENSGVAINRSGNATFWGGLTNYNFRDPTQFPGNRYAHTYVSAALGRDHGLLLTDTGAVDAWGAPESMEPVSIPNTQWTSGFTAVAAGRNFSLGLDAKGFVHVAAPTNDEYHILDIPAAATTLDPVTRKGPVTAIAAGPYHAMALTTNGEVLVWGAWCAEEEESVDPIDDSFWSNAVPSKAVARAPVPRNSLGNVTNVPPGARSGVKAIAAGYNLCAALTETGAVLVWGSDKGTGGVLARIPPYAAQDIQQLAVGHQHIVVRSTWLPPEFTADTLPDAHLESEYDAVVPLRAYPAAVVKVSNERLLPPGISLSSKGVFSGVPTTLGTNTFAVVASNAYGSVTQFFSIVVREPSLSVPVWKTTELPTAVVGFPFGYQYGYPCNGFQLEATGSPTFTAEGLPSWLKLSASGLLTGTPTNVGSAYPSFTAANSAGATQRLFQVVVDAQSADTPPVIGLEDFPDLRVGTATNIDLQIIGATAVSLSGDLAPPSFRIVSTNGTWILTGTPTDSLHGDGRTAVIVASNATASTTREYSVNVKGAPRWVTDSLKQAVLKEPYTATLVANWASSYQIAVADLRPIPLSLSMVTNEENDVVAILSGTPTNTIKTSFSIPVTAVNDYGTTDRTFTLTLSDVALPEYRFLSIVPSSSQIVLTWTNDTGASSAILLSTTNLLSWPKKGTTTNSPATLKRPKVPTFYGLQAP